MGYIRKLVFESFDLIISFGTAFIIPLRGRREEATGEDGQGLAPTPQDLRKSHPARSSRHCATKMVSRLTCWVVRL